MILDRGRNIAKGFEWFKCVWIKGLVVPRETKEKHWVYEYVSGNQFKWKMKCQLDGCINVRITYWSNHAICLGCLFIY